MAKSLSLQLKEALSARDEFESRLAAIADERQELTLRAESLAGDLQAANQLSESLQAKVDELTAANEELAHDFANAQEELNTLKAQSQTVTEAAAVQAATIVADIGVPPVSGDAVATTPQKTKEELYAEYHELNQRDPRAAAKFLNETIRPLIFKEAK